MCVSRKLSGLHAFGNGIAALSAINPLEQFLGDGNGQLVADLSPATKRARPPVSGFSGRDGYMTHGLRESPLRSEEGRKLVSAYRSQGLSPDKALALSRELLASGSTLPKAITLAAGESLFKIVPEGHLPSPHSAFFASREEVTVLMEMNYDQIADRLGLPLESQQTLRFDVVEVRTTRAVTVFESTIAPTTQNGYLQPGGGKQILITHRSAFTDPTVIGRMTMALCKRKLVKVDEQTGDYAEVDSVRLKREARELVDYIEAHVDPRKDPYGIWPRLVPLCRAVLADTVPLPIPFSSLPLRYERREGLLDAGLDERLSGFALTISGTAREILEEVTIDGARYMYADFEV
jgi:hypothetical protein